MELVPRLVNRKKLAEVGPRVARKPENPSLSAHLYTFLQYRILYCSLSKLEPRKFFVFVNSRAEKGTEGFWDA